MTKEELEKEAEAFKESKRHRGFRVDVEMVNINYESYLNNLKQAYIAGRTQWHDLRKDPNDLPKNTEFVLCFLWGTTYDVGFYEETDDELWHFDEYSVSKSHKEDVVAWCELPKFEEE